MLGVSGSNPTPGKTFFFSIFILRIYFENLQKSKCIFLDKNKNKKIIFLDKKNDFSL